MTVGACGGMEESEQLTLRYWEPPDIHEEEHARTGISTGHIEFWKFRISFPFVDEIFIISRCKNYESILGLDLIPGQAGMLRWEF
jgi:hypothetical protein